MIVKEIFADIKQREIYLYFLILLAFFFPFYKEILPYLIFATGASWLFSKRIKEKLQEVIRNKYFIIILIFYLLHFFGVFYSSNSKHTWFNLEVRLSFVVLPLVIFSSQEKIIAKKEIMIKAFIAGTLLSSFICYIIALYRAHQHASDGSFFNFDVWNLYPDNSFLQIVLSGRSFLNHGWFSFFTHVNYFSMYIILSLYFLFNYLIKSKFRNYPLIFSFIFLFITLLLIQARAPIIALSLIVIYISIRTLLQPGKKLLKLSISAILIIAISILILKSGRFEQIFHDNTDLKIDKLKESNVRLQLWSHSIPIIKENLFFGVGTGDVDDVFRKNYNTDLYKNTKDRYFNFHNEFIETTVRLGILGIISLLMLLYFPLFQKKEKTKEEYNMLVVFSILITVEFFFESMLVRLNGVAFFAFFYSILNIRSNSIKNS